MSRYLFMIYDDALSDLERDQLSGLFYEAKVEILDVKETHHITCSYLKLYDYSNVGYCYRIHRDEIVPSLSLIGKTPRYIGLFTKDIETACLRVSEFCYHISHECQDFDGIWTRARQNFLNYKEIFADEYKIDWDEIEKLETFHQDMLMDAEMLLADVFNDNEYDALVKTINR